MRDLLRTDAYKLSMAQAGFPLRRETFYFSFRKGGWHFLPFDLEREVRVLVEAGAEGGELEEQAGFADRHGYSLSPAMRQALAGELQIEALPAGCWAAPREPIMTLTGAELAGQLARAVGASFSSCDSVCDRLATWCFRRAHGALRG